METIVRDRPATPAITDSGCDAQNRIAGPAIDYQTEAVRLCEIGKILLNAGRYQAALDQFEQALAVHPHDVESWYNRAEALASLNRYKDALHSLEQAQELAGLAETRIWIQKAVLLILLNSPKAALTCCNYALWLEPHHHQAWLFRGVSLDRLGRHQEAYRSYQRVGHRVNPTWQNHFRRLCHDITTHPQAS